MPLADPFKLSKKAFLNQLPSGEHSVFISIYPVLEQTKIVE
jgi:hypothetical protein